jgi:hypothetical protein
MSEALAAAAPLELYIRDLPPPLTHGETLNAAELGDFWKAAQGLVRGYIILEEIAQGRCERPGRESLTEWRQLLAELELEWCRKGPDQAIQAVEEISRLQAAAEADQAVLRALRREQAAAQDALGGYWRPGMSLAAGITSMRLALEGQVANLGQLCLLKDEQLACLMGGGGE